MSTRRALTLALALLPFSGCACEESLAPVGGDLVGTVCDSATGLPLAWKKVRLETGGPRREAETGGDGTFAIRDVPAGTLTLVVPEAGTDRRVEVDVEGGETTTFYDEACRGDPNAGGKGRIEGIVCDRHTGAVVTQGQVQVVLPDGSSLDAATDAAGEFAIEDVPAGEHVLSIFAVGYQRSFLVRVFPGETTTIEQGNDCRPALASEGFVSGALCDPNGGGPLVGADVRGVDASGDVHDDVTDTDGAFLLGPMPAGLVNIDVSRAPGVAFSVQATIVAGDEVVVASPFTCGGSEVGPGNGRVEGRVCAPDGTTWLSGAEVFIELPGGDRISSSTDGQGRWALEGVPPGTWDVHVRAGSFESIIVVVVDEDETTVVLPDSECAIDQDVKIAVVEGIWDDVRTVLVDVGIEEGIITDFSTGWAYELLGDPAYLATFDIVMINCGADEYEYVGDATLQQNLIEYVEAGGSLYVSDLAYDVVEIAFPDALDFYGADETQDSAEVGAQMELMGTIVDPSLSSAIGTSQIDVNYPLAYWAIMEDEAADTRVYIRGTGETLDGEYLSDIAHTVSFRRGEGKVVFSSFHQEPGINVLQEQVLQLLVFQL
jgi:hypothetical protein